MNLSAEGVGPARFALLLAVGLAAGALARPVSGAGSEASAALLRRAGEYVAAYERELPAIVAEEDYTQRFIVELHTEVRRLRADLLTVRDDTYGWTGFRDVFEVDGRPVRDRTDRLARLFLEPYPEARSQARRIADEGARFNVAPQVLRTINTPLLALQFIRAQNQGRSTFVDAGTTRGGRAEIATVDFKESALPRIVQTPDNAAARGRFWIETATGRIMETELLVDTKSGGTGLNSRILVAYAEEPRLGMWLPISMDETYQGYGVIVAHAKYSNFRRFSVSTETVLKNH